MIIRNHASSSARLFKTADNRLTDHSQRSTAHLIEPQTYFSLVSGEKADNQNKFYRAVFAHSKVSCKSR